MRQIKYYFPLFILFFFGILSVGGATYQNMLNSSDSREEISATDRELKQKVLGILKAKCNVCHKKQNPFKVFSERNMERHAPKIYEQVFVKRRMPKGNEITLTEEEYGILKQWLFTQIN